jgi:hypothetical protein
MLDLATAILTVDDFTFFVAVTFVAIAFWLIREMVDSLPLALLCSPFLLAGALAANYLFRINFVTALQDKDSNVVVASAIGVICALVLLMISIWISVLMSERLSKKRELAQLPTVAPTQPN